ncbi:hypothetical protein BX600DRAFT_553013 [Xylariales sp. PMI_506]|nr:hypothetical protein BX600DRAFT_553013 [Xylariales sp. PMI_506]
MLQPPKWALLGMLASIEAVQAQNSSAPLTPSLFLAEIPSCAQPCMESGIQAANCSIDSIGQLADCICLGIQLQSDFNACVQSSCASPADQGIALYVEDALCSAYPKQSRQNLAIHAAIIAIVLSTPIVMARCAARLKLNNRLWLDDYMSIAALFALFGLAGVIILAAKKGLGLHYWNVDFSNATTLGLCFFISQILYLFVQFSGKIAILLLYQRIFEVGSTARWFWWAIKICLGLAVSAEGAYLIVICVQCVPLAGMWDTSITDAKCIDLDAVALTGAIMSIIADLVLITLPMTVIFKLQIDRRKRIAVSFVFAIASVGVIASIVRLVFLTERKSSVDYTWDDMDVTLCSLTEIICIVICGSVPALWPLLVRITPKVSMTFSMSVSWRKSTGSGSGDASDPSKASYDPRSSNNAENKRHISYPSSQWKQNAWQIKEEVVQEDAHELHQIDRPYYR